MRHKGLVEFNIMKYQAASVPRATLEVEAWKLFDDAVKNYQIGSAAKFSTFASIYLYRLDRYTKTHQNVARIPEGLASNIGRYDRASLQLREELGREPTHKELGRAVGLSAKRVATLETSRRRDLFEGGFEGDTEVTLGRTMANKHVLEDVRPLLNQQELLVYDHLIGFGGVKKMEDNNALAAKLGLSAGRVSQIKKSIAEKIGPHVRKSIR